ncbi:hypothetical protein AX16_005670 [Volvariella volvacea WC 439]|nr:hypothetical protein AX16_005670 [Volvariella volvacea WC 439]
MDLLTMGPPSLSQILSTFLLCITIWFLSGMLKHLRIAKQIGLPYIYWPVTEGIVYFVFMASPLGRWFVFNLCPQSLRPRVFHSTTVWRWNAKYDFHQRYGDVLATVAPGSVEIHVADADVIWEMATGRRFFKDAGQYALLNVMGQNVVTTEGSMWVRHRKHTSKPFNERNNALVWRESLFQGEGMLSKWETLRAPGGDHLIVPHFYKDIRHLALNVISAAGFGVHLSFDKRPTSEDQIQAQGDSDSSLDGFFSDRYIPPGFQRSYRDAVTFLNSILAPVLIVSKMFSDQFLEKSPPFLRRYYHAKSDVRNYLHKLISNEQEKMASGARHDGRNNLLSILVQEGEDVDTDKFEPFTDDEVIGNTFIFSVAGHETAAAAITFALALLALHPDKQAWLHQKIDDALARQPENPAEWPYELYERLMAPLSVMNETLRLFPIVNVIPRITGDVPTPITWNNRTYVLPPRLHVSYNITAVHYNPAYWGPAPAEFDPSRWDASNKSSYLHRFSSSSESEMNPGMLKPKRGAFVPFSEGIRGCLGKKFAQVEFVAVLTLLLRKKVVGLATLPGEGAEDAKRRVWKVMEECVKKNGLLTDKFGIKLLPREGQPL